MKLNIWQYTFVNDRTKSYISQKDTTNLDYLEFLWRMFGISLKQIKLIRALHMLNHTHIHINLSCIMTNQPVIRIPVQRNGDKVIILFNLWQRTNWGLLSCVVVMKIHAVCSILACDFIHAIICECASLKPHTRCNSNSSCGKNFFFFLFHSISNFYQNIDQ